MNLKNKNKQKSHPPKNPPPNPHFGIAVDPIPHHLPCSSQIPAPPTRMV